MPVCELKLVGGRVEVRSRYSPALVESSWSKRSCGVAHSQLREEKWTDRRARRR
jgi:hypothetical protein